jgi:hypothetical protein
VVVEAGVTTRLPCPTYVPPQLPVYQSMSAPGPTEPDRVEDVPTQIVAGFAMRSVGVAGRALTVTIVLVEALQPLELVTVSEYVPAIAEVALDETVGLWRFEVKPFGPVQK